MTNELRPDPELSASLRAEFRAERREEEREAVRHAWARRRLRDAAAEAMRRGDQVIVHLAGRRVTGTVTAVGTDYAAVVDVTGAVVVHLGAGTPILQIRAHAQGCGVQAPGDPKTFLAALRSYQIDQDRDPRGRRMIELGTPTHPDGLVGRLEAVAVDHVYLRDRHGCDWYIPTTAISYLTWAAGDHG